MQDLLTDVIATAQRLAADRLARLERWVCTSSFTGDADGVNAMGTRLVEAFDRPELTLERVPGGDFGDHLIWRTPAWERAGAARTLLVGHHDTVFPPGVFERWHVEGDRLEGPGVYDMKGGLVIIRDAVVALSEHGALARLPLAIVSVADEEVGSPHSRASLTELSRGAVAALVFEGGRDGDAVVTRRKGTGRFHVVAEGRAAHAGNCHAEGINAIAALSGFITAVSALTDYARGVTTNVGRVAGGTGANTVPGGAECDLDFRFEHAEDGGTVEAAVRGVAAGMQASTGARFQVHGGIRRLPLEPGVDARRLHARYAAHARAAGLDAPECPLIGGGSDANTVSAAGVPTIDGLGPRGGGFHTLDEHIEVSSLALRVEALLRFLLG